MPTKFGTGNFAEDQIAIPCLFMRGGSSRGGFFLEEDLPADPMQRAATLLACYGSPDVRQIDGIGGGDPLTSKAAIVGASKHPGADLDYTFCQVGIDRPQVSTGGNCGNMLAAVASFGILRGLIEPKEPETAVRVFTTNTRQIVTVRISVARGKPLVEGNAKVAGVPGTGSRVAIDFGDCAGSVSGRLLPSGHASDHIELEGRTIQVSLVDAATPFVFVAMDSVGAKGTELPCEICADIILMTRLELVRGWAAKILGLVDDPSKASEISPNLPRVIMVAPPISYTGTAGEVERTEIDLCVRQLAMQKPHNTLAVTGAVCTAVAAKIPGTVVNKLARVNSERIRLGHPAGTLGVSAIVQIDADGLHIRSAAIERTARLIMAGEVYASRKRIEQVVASMRSGSIAVAELPSSD